MPLWKSRNITDDDGVPSISYKKTFFNSIASRYAIDSQEAEIYQLAHVLFDDYDDDFSISLDSNQKQRYAHRIRKERLSRLWKAKVTTRSLDGQNSEDPETAALLCLSIGDIDKACKILLEGRDYILAGLISQLEHTDVDFQEDMQNQIKVWRDMDMISEMTEPIRGLYELLAGNTTISEGKRSGPLENRATTFSISERFDLDWKQAFGLCLWYGPAKHGSIGEIVADFTEKVASREESAAPNFGNLDAEDPLWVLLRLYAARSDPKVKMQPPELPEALLPLTGPAEYSAALQLQHALAANISGLSVNTEAADQLASDLAFQYSAVSAYKLAISAFLHLSKPEARKLAIQDLLYRFAGHIPNDPAFDLNASATDKKDWADLTEQLRIPIQWICAAKAQFYRALGDPAMQLRYLLKADEWRDAHLCLVKRVAPRIVVDENWRALKNSIDAFETGKNRVDDWDIGGGVFEDFLSLMTGNVKGKDERTLLESLQGKLKRLSTKHKEGAVDMTKANGGDEEVVERVAVLEMGRVVAKRLAEAGAQVTIPSTLSAEKRLTLSADEACG